MTHHLLPFIKCLRNDLVLNINTYPCIFLICNLGKLASQDWRLPGVGDWWSGWVSGSTYVVHREAPHTNSYTARDAAPAQTAAMPLESESPRSSSPEPPGMPVPLSSPPPITN